MKKTVAATAAATFGALAAAAFVGAGWARDAAERERKAAALHRALVELLLNALSAGDPVTERHSRRVADLTDALAATYGFRQDRHSTLRLAALLHDLGKIDDRFFPILHSCSPLTREEREEINQHPGESAEILEPLESVHPGITSIVEAHHEYWDGQGYPLGLRGEEIPLEARLISVADVFDALTQPRAYRDPLSAEQALEEIRRGAGSRFDPRVVGRLESDQVLRRWKAIMERGHADERDGERGDAAAGADSKPDFASG